MEYIRIEFTREKWEAIRHYLELTPEIDYTIKDVKIKDDMFKDDESHTTLKKAAVKSYKALNDYEFNKRHKI